MTMTATSLAAAEDAAAAAAAVADAARPLRNGEYKQTNNEACVRYLRASSFCLRHRHARTQTLSSYRQK